MIWDVLVSFDGTVIKAATAFISLKKRCPLVGYEGSLSRGIEIGANHIQCGAVLIYSENPHDKTP